MNSNKRIHNSSTSATRQTSDENAVTNPKKQKSLDKIVAAVTQPNSNSENISHLNPSQDTTKHTSLTKRRIKNDNNTNHGDKWVTAHISYAEPHSDSSDLSLIRFDKREISPVPESLSFRYLANDSPY